MRLMLTAEMVVGAAARVVVLVAPEITPATAGVVIVARKGRKCSWFEVELRRLSGNGILLLLLLLRTAGAAGRLLQVRLLLSCRLL